MRINAARIIAYYLPQFHPIPENDEWWGKGFTEWTNVSKAKPLFYKHYQPKIPADLGYYDLRLSEVRIAQAEMAKEAGIEGFCYWQYWFNKDKQLLERPFNEVLESGSPNYPFCLGWANHSWTNKSWNASKRHVKEQVLIEQTYDGEDAYKSYFQYNLKAFKDSRYINVNNKPLFVIYDPYDIPDVTLFINIWNQMAIDYGFKGIHFVGIAHNLTGYYYDNNNKKKYYFVNPKEKAINRYNDVLSKGFNAINSRGNLRAELLAKGRLKTIAYFILNKILDGMIIDKYEYRKIIKYLFVDEDELSNVYPTIIPNWDRSPRSGKKAKIWYGSTPELFGVHVKMALDLVKNKDYQDKIIFLQSWNEWAEGNYIEPDLNFGKKYLEILRDNIFHKFIDKTS